MRPRATTQIDGYLSKDAELRQTRDGRSVLTLTVPYTRRRHDKQANEWVDAAPTLWVTVTLWDEAALHFAERMRKGTPVHVEGIPEIRTWEKDGRSGFSFELAFPQVSIVAEAPRQAGASQQSAPQQADSTDAWATPGWSMDDTPF